ncbi:MAG: S9 family peptidase [Propionibacteriaceae bacterium]|jgi:oligopeptidase B|nr:S9 family peptidase [Propionibacteriaceae bacterium]
MQPPVAPRRTSRRVIHGDVFDDPYAWMRDPDELAGYLEAEAAYCLAETADIAGLADEIYSEVLGRTLQTDLSVPNYVTHDDGRAFWYYARTTAGLEYPAFYRAPASSRDVPGEFPGEELLLDANAEADGHGFFALGTLDISPDGNQLAYSVDYSGDEHYDLYFLTLGGRPSEPITDVAAGGAWLGNTGYCYLRTDAAWRTDRVFFHSRDGADTLLHHETDERFWLSVDESRDRRRVIITAGSKNTSECWLFDGAAMRSFWGRRESVEYELEVLGDDAYILHNLDGPDFALARASVADPTSYHTLIGHVPGTRLLGVSAYDSALVVSYRREGLTRVAVGKDGFTEIEWDEPLFTLEADGAEDPGTDRIRLTYQSLVTPEQVFDYMLETGEKVLLKQRPVLDYNGVYRRGDYVQERLWATSPDGTQVPISLVRRADTKPGGCLLYGYGAYEISISPSFSILRLSLLDRGYSYAIAHVRGGGELGRAWYEGGRMAAKPNTFADFTACARHLVAAGYTTADRLAIAGGSAGGLLIGAVLNQTPAAFGAAHAAVPFVDALNTILDPSLPLTVTEWEEWGDPLHDPQIYRLMKSYTPYENVRPQHYPPLLVTAGINDTRVEITEPAKWVAALRHAAPETQIHFKVEGAGHSGVSGRYAAWRDAAFELAWLIAHTTV